MAGSIEIRPAVLEDAAGLAHVHATCDDPWSDAVEGAIWLNHRLVRGFGIDVAVYRGAVVAHAEWIVSHEPAPRGRHLYLGVLQVHAECQRRGIGRAMLAAGVSRAAAASCSRITTIPDDDARGFYARCQMTRYGVVQRVVMDTVPTTLPRHWRRMRSVPRRVATSLPMRLGWVQASAAHMWELCNRPVRLAGECDRHPCAMRDGEDAHVQVRYVGAEYPAVAVAWASARTAVAELVEVAMALASVVGATQLTVAVLDRERRGLASVASAAEWVRHEIWERRL